MKFLKQLQNEQIYHISYENEKELNSNVLKEDHHIVLY